MPRLNAVLAVLLSAAVLVHGAQDVKSTDLSALTPLVAALKKDPKGPYKAIRWFCNDGRLLTPPETCGDSGGLQRALYKDTIVTLQKNHNLWLGQILTTTDTTAFLDSANDFSRLKQYAVDQYLQENDDGWILRRGRFYRGAIQVEDEERWGRMFLLHLLGRKDLLQNRFLLCREAVRVVPHRANDRTLEKVRWLSKQIADSVISFNDIRIKLHGQPDRSDIERVAKWRLANQKKLKPEILTQLAELDSAMRRAFAPNSGESLQRFVEKISTTAPVRPALEKLRSTPMTSARDFCTRSAEVLTLTRQGIPSVGKAAGRAFLMDLSLTVERLMFMAAGDWQPATTRELLDKNYVMARASAACGYLEQGEWASLEPAVRVPTDSAISTQSLALRNERIRRAVEWGSQMIVAFYDKPQSTFASFEPLAAGFIDDRIRSSVLLCLANSAAELAELNTRLSGTSHTVFDIASAQQARGINPGYARGTLEVISSGATQPEFLADRIYLMDRPPPSLRPVAGLGTVSEGNALSHVALLARNLGIPNAVFGSEAIEQIRPRTGTPVFYAVSPRGRVIIKPQSNMTASEKALFAERKGGPKEMVSIPVNSLELNSRSLPALYDLRASHSGKLCGPKAANLGQLSALFPGMVAPGLVIPFGVFDEHMKQSMPQSDTTYWDFLKQTFEHASSIKESEREGFIIQRLTTLRTAISTITFLPSFLDTLRARFAAVFSAPVGSTLVFVRSDTNAEDLKDFTGAGLNLTVPNVFTEEQLLQAIRDVWASPYTERSYRWRQKFLRNPSHVYPSILVQKSVDCDKSGVIITTGVHSHDTSAITVSFSRGVGGAVDAQAAESYEIDAAGNAVLHSPAREPSCNRLNPRGGTRTVLVPFSTFILSPAELARLHAVAGDVRRKLPQAPGISTRGPFDTEMGFAGETLYLFQARPFVENKNAQASEYLRSLDNTALRDTTISLDSPLLTGGVPAPGDSK